MRKINLSFLCIMLLLILNSCKKNTQDPNALNASVVNDTTNFLFEDNSTGVTLTRYKGTATHVTVPSMYKNKPVTKITGYLEKNSYYPDYQPEFPYIAHGAFANTLIESLIIPNSVTEINGVYFDTLIVNSNQINQVGVVSNPFENCSQLTNIKFPDSLKYLEINLFGCNSLKSLTIPSKVWYLYILNIYESNLEILKFESTNFPSPTHIFRFSNRIPAITKIYVPKECIDKYKKSHIFMDYDVNQIVGF